MCLDSNAVSLFLSPEEDEEQGEGEGGETVILDCVDFMSEFHSNITYSHKGNLSVKKQENFLNVNIDLHIISRHAGCTYCP